MALAAGTKLGSYEVVAQIGAGGMGEVYRARDTKLGRDVAIKVLPEAFAHDPERLSRFQREAKLLASLNHPNIAHIYGLEESAGSSYLAMELVAGETLAERVKVGPLPIEEALKIGVQIAEALEAAHEKNIIHRDLKPANVKVTPEGKVKVLDFGLAKAFEGDLASEDMANSPTLSRGATMQGVILGTAAYMSPEQARGKAVDKRTDIWALGCVLYEMLTAKQAFHGEDVTDILAAVVKAEPDWTSLPANTPLVVRKLLKRCLQKDRAQRLRDAGDARIDIEDAAFPQTAVEPTSQSRNGRLISPLLAALIGALALAAGIGIGAWLWRPAARQGAEVARLTLLVPPGADLGDFASLAVSPDGTEVAYVATSGGVTHLYIRPLNSIESKLLPGTEGAATPFFSPDGRWLGFFASGKLKKISTSGGVSTTLADAAGFQGGSWSPKDTIVFRGAAETGLMEISAAGGAPRRIPDTDPGTRALQFPQFLPGGKAVLFTSVGADTATADDKSIGVLTLETGAWKTLVQGGSNGLYLESGHLVFLRSGTLMAVPFDLDRLEISGAPVAVINGVREGVTGLGAFSCSRGGTCAYAGGGLVGAQNTAALVDRSGASQALPRAPRAYSNPRFSPAGDKVALWIQQVNCDVVVYDLARNTMARLTDSGDNHFPSWTPDGKRIAYISHKLAALPGYEPYWRPADGSGSEERVSPTPLKLVPITPIAWSPDGHMLAFVDRGNIWLLPMSGEQKPRPFFQSKFDETEPAFSPDGRWLAYVSDESSRPEVYVQPFPGPGAKYTISTEGGTEPIWARSGRELFFRNGDRMMAVSIGTQSGFNASTPKLLFAESQPFVRTAGRIGYDYDVSPDGQHFIILMAGKEEQSASQINVVLNWFEELKQKVPTGMK